MFILHRKWLLILLIDFIALICGVLIPQVLLMILILVVWSNGVIYTLEDLNKRGALFAFLVSFFLILIGREALEVFGLHEVEKSFSHELNQLAEWLILLSLSMLFIGYALANRLTFNKNASNRDHNYNSTQYISVRQVSSTLFFLTFAFNIFSVLDIVLFVMEHGYITYYISYVSRVPYVIKKIGDMCLVCFWIFLATMPEKKKVDRLSVFYVLYLFLTLGTGKRFPFVAGLFTLLVYYIARNRLHSGGIIWVKRKTLVLFFVLTPILAVGLYMVGQIRIHNQLESMRIDRVIINFLYGQGVSINVIKRAQLYRNLLPKGKLYLFGSTFEAISNNVIFRLLGATQYTGNTVEHALNGYSFQHALSYVSMGSYYISGHGLGSCYIAEAFHDLGYFGVVLVNLLYGLMFRKVFDFKRHGIWGTTIVLSMLYSLLLAPRGSADGFITDIVDLTTWGTILIVWAFSKIGYNNAS